MHLNERLSSWRRRRGTVAPPKKGNALHLKGTEIVAIVIVALVAIAGIAYVAVNDKPNTNNYYGFTVSMWIYGAIDNSTGPGVCCTIPASYDPSNFTVPVGTHVTLDINNSDTLTHGLAIPSFNLDTGPMKPNSTTVLTFTVNTAGNYTYNEPPADCGGGNCDAGQALNGFFVVTS